MTQENLARLGCVGRRSRTWFIHLLRAVSSLLEGYDMLATIAIVPFVNTPAWSLIPLLVREHFHGGPAGADRMSEEQRRYMAYLLRLWQAEHKGALVWRAFLESAHADKDHPMGERRCFASLAELYAFLDQETAAVNECKLPKSANDQGR